MSANKALYDDSLRHAIALRRYSTGEVKQVLKLLGRSEDELMAKLVKLDPARFSTKRQQALLADIQAARVEAVRELGRRSGKEMTKLAKVEQDFNITSLKRSIPASLEYARVSTDVLRELVTTRPFAGGTNAARTLGQWWEGVARADQQRITDAIQLGVTQGEDIPSITRRVMQATDMTRNNAEAVTRTAVNHVSNGVRERVMDANSDIVAYETWVSTLDGRTTLICASRDGHNTPIGDRKQSDIPTPHLEPAGARPPAHPQCRSVMVPVLDGEGLARKAGNRPTVVDARTRKERERDFRAEAKEAAGRKWSDMSDTERRRAITRVRDTWAEEAIGTASTQTTYDEWLRGQDADFQNDVLGPARADMFRSGTKLDQFLDDTGKTLTLDELERR